MDSPEYGEWRATHDPLTGLFNRNELERLRLEGPNEPLGVICFTLQDLGAWGGGKAIQGFEGDRELKDFANRLTLVALPGTFVVRLGSDEFIALVTGSPVHEVMAAQLEDYRQEFTAPDDPLCITAKLKVGTSTAVVETFADIYRGMKLAHDAYYWPNT